MEINLPHAKLTALPCLNISLNEITYINLFDNNFTKVPKEIYKMTNLKVLNISANEIGEIPASIKI
ncbi:hypothetical protein E8L90_06660 [Brevibacillus antibioticus]|uniref:Leucine-rich repeat domain-containing protein n=1 Tax=Brevibacillus antibioticus TaxID=2570228 RepID=A0A4U2Y5W7_9BACL|nr:hypothetical protein E8L90_06660 [Brevibacillus antibioticus]